MRIYLFSIILLISISCAKKPAEETAEAIDIALTHLSKDECDKAIEILEDIDDDENAVYLQVLASAYACKARYDEISFVSNDLKNLVTTTGATVITSLSIMSYSSETAADSEAYVNFRRAINILLSSAPGAPSHTSRVSKFGARKAGDIGVQALLLNVVNFGKFLHFYGNVNATGVKGGGASSNTCFLNYTDPRAQGVVGSGVTGACSVNNNGHPDLDQSTDVGKRRLCEGLVLLTNILDILDNLDLSGSDDLSVLEDISAQVNTYKSAAVSAGLGTLINMTSQSRCVSHLGTLSNLNDMEYLYSLIFETGLQ